MVGDILQPTHLLFVLVVALLVLGPKRLPEVAKTLGNGLRDFRSALSGDSHHDEDEPPRHFLPPEEPKTEPGTTPGPVPGHEPEAASVVHGPGSDSVPVAAEPEPAAPEPAAPEPAASAPSAPAAAAPAPAPVPEATQPAEAEAEPTRPAAVPKQSS